MIYLDHNATSPLLATVARKIQQALESDNALIGQANPNSIHRAGRETRALIEEARTQIAKAIGCEPGEIIFTGSATEANFLALMGHAIERRRTHSIIWTSVLEHPSISENLELLRELFGFEVRTIPVTATGEMDLVAFSKIFAPLAAKSVLVCASGGHNESGILQSYKDLAQLCAGAKVPLHSDLVQCLGRVEIDLKVIGLSSASFGFHKMGGPKGIGALWLRKGVALSPVLRGGAQEKKRRAGTENTLLILAAAESVREINKSIEQQDKRVRALRDQLEIQILQIIKDAKVIGQNASRLPNTSYIVFPGVRSDALLAHLDLAGVCASSGAACSSGMVLASKSLLALGYSEAEAISGIRFSLAPSNTSEEIERVAELTVEGVQRLRKLGPRPE